MKHVLQSFCDILCPKSKFTCAAGKNLADFFFFVGKNLQKMGSNFTFFFGEILFNRITPPSLKKKKHGYT